MTPRTITELTQWLSVNLRDWEVVTIRGTGMKDGTQEIVIRFRPAVQGWADAQWLHTVGFGDLEGEK